MEVNEQLILKLENLARLELSAAERQQLIGDLGNILNMVEQLNTLDTEGVAPLVYVSDEVNIWREDAVKNELSREKALVNAPDANAAFFKVPKVIQTSE